MLCLFNILQFSHVISYLIQYLFCLESVHKMNYYFSFIKIRKEMSRQRRLHLFQSGNVVFYPFYQHYFFKKTFHQLCLKSLNRCHVCYMCLQVYLLILSAIWCNIYIYFYFIFIKLVTHFGHFISRRISNFSIWYPMRHSPPFLLSHYPFETQIQIRHFGKTER